MCSGASTPGATRRPTTKVPKAPIPNYTELAVVVIEAVLLLGIAVPLWAKNVQQFPRPEDATVIQIVAQQFAWNARYPGPDWENSVRKR